MADRPQFADNPFAAPESDIRPEQYEASDAPVGFATFWQRFAASFVDGIVIQILSIALGFSIGIVGGAMGLAGDDGSDALEALGGLVGLLTFWLYYVLQESSESQATLGKRLIGLRVTDLQGRRISFGRATLRLVCKILSYLTLLIGFLIQPFTKRKQALHDLLAGTLVIKA